jgi:hypothetical protein
MELSQTISGFFLAIRDDPRISPIHISIYMALVELSIEKQYVTPMLVYSHEVKLLAKVSGPATYHGALKDLHNYGYIRYTPSFNRFEGSQIQLIKHLISHK